MEDHSEKKSTKYRKRVEVNEFKVLHLWTHKMQYYAAVRIHELDIFSLMKFSKTYW